MNSFLLLEIKTKFEVWCVSCAVEGEFFSIYVLIDKTRAEVGTALLLAIKGFNDTSPY